MLRHGAGIVHIIERAAAAGGLVALNLGQPPLIPELHRQADHVLAARMQHPSNYGAIHAPGHRDGKWSFTHKKVPAFANALRNRPAPPPAHPLARWCWIVPARNGYSSGLPDGSSPSPEGRATARARHWSRPLRSIPRIL